jgi:cytochrome c oxidase subunit I+III
MFVIDFLLHFLQGKRAETNSWNAPTLEWALATPIPPYNFVSQPEVSDRDPLWQDPHLPARARAGRYFLGRSDVDRRETLITGTVHAEPEAVAVLPGNTWTPLVAALFTALFFIGFLSKLYWLAAAGAALAVAALTFWAWQNLESADGDEIDAGADLRLPCHYATRRSPGWWGTLITLLADGALFFSLLFAFLFLWTVSPGWPPAAYRDAGLLLPSAALAALAASGALVWWGEAAHSHGRMRRFRAATCAAIILAVVFVVLQALAVHGGAIPARAHAYGALLHAISGYQFVHVAIAVLMAGVALLRSRTKNAGPRRPVAAQVTALFWLYTVLQWLAGFATIHLFPFLAGS